MDIDTSGEFRPMKLPDGWYIVGNGMITPVESQQQAIDLIKKYATYN